MVVVVVVVVLGVVDWLGHGVTPRRRANLVAVTMVMVVIVIIVVVIVVVAAERVEGTIPDCHNRPRLVAIEIVA